MHKAASGQLRNALAVSYKASLEDIVRVWKRNGLPIDQPDFYDHPRYVRVEQAQPGYINTYARYVRDQRYSEHYLDRSEAVIQAASSLLNREVIADGRANLCVAASKVLSKILE